MISGFLQIAPTDARKATSTKNGVILGTPAVTRDGKVYRFTKDSGAGLATGILTVNPDADANVVDVTVAATVAKDARSVVIDAGGTIVADAYVDGYLTVSDATGQGHNYLVTGNTGVSGAGEITVSLAEPLVEGLTVDVSEVTLLKNNHDSVVLSATNQLDVATGVTNTSVTASYYFWAQVTGVCSVKADASTHARGSEATISGLTAGAIGLKDGLAETVVGVYDQVAVSTEYRSTLLRIG